MAVPDSGTTFNLLDMALSIIGTLGLFLLTEVWLEIKNNRRESKNSQVTLAKHEEQLRALRARVARIEAREVVGDEGEE